MAEDLQEMTWDELSREGAKRRIAELEAEVKREKDALLICDTMARIKSLEIGRLRGVLREIAEHPHCEWENPSAWTIADSVSGHRCAAEIARKVLKNDQTDQD